MAATIIIYAASADLFALPAYSAAAAITRHSTLFTAAAEHEERGDATLAAAMAS